MSYERLVTDQLDTSRRWATTPQEATDGVLRSCATVFAAQCRARPSTKFPKDASRAPRLLYGRGLGADEAAGFVRALKHDLIRVAPDGGFQVPGARACSLNLHLVGRNEDHVALHT